MTAYLDSSLPWWKNLREEVGEMGSERCGMSSNQPSLFIDELGTKFVFFWNFFRIFWSPNGQKRLIATAS